MWPADRSSYVRRVTLVDEFSAPLGRRAFRTPGQRGALSAVIEVEALHKSYRRRRGGRVRALDGLELSVRAGGVFGFLGPNGSGKTTTIRCLLGLARPSSGQCRVLGSKSPEGLSDVIGRVGALVEAPGVNPGVSGRQTLTILATTAGSAVTRSRRRSNASGSANGATISCAATRSACASVSGSASRC